jgi:hypothetical protein
MWWGIEVKDVLIFLIGLPVAILISRYFFKRGLSRKQIVYSMHFEDTLFKGDQYPAKLEIVYDGVPINVLSKSEIYIWNGGNQPITEDDLKTDDRLRIAWPMEFEVLDCSLRYQSRAANKVAIGAGSQISFAYLNVGDGAIIDVVGTRKSKERLKGTRDYGEVCGEIIGAAQQPKREDFLFAVKRNHVPLTLLGFGIAALFVYFIYTDRASYTGEFYWYYVPFGLASAIVILIMFITGTLGIAIWLKGDRVPMNMIVGGHRSMTWQERLKLYF